MRARKKKLLKSYKSKIRFQNMDMAQKQKQDSWQSFLKGKGAKKKTGFLTGGPGEGPRTERYIRGSWSATVCVVTGVVMREASRHNGYGRKPQGKRGGKCKDRHCAEAAAACRAQPQSQALVARFDALACC